MSSNINYITFNQDHSFLAVGTTDGFRIYSVDPFNLVFQTPLTENGASGDVSILEMLLSTSLVAMILSPRLLRIINTKRQSTLCELTFPTRVGALRLNRKRLLVVLDDVIFFYDMQTMKLLHQVTTPVNTYSICALSPHSENNYVAYPMSRQEYTSPSPAPSHVPISHQNPSKSLSGDLMLFDATEMQELKVVSAHQSPLSCIAINSDGTLLATASEKGTIIRVFAIPSATKLFQFRRGSMPARIHYMSFNATSTLLCVSSATDTIHIFKLTAQPHAGQDPDPSDAAYSPITSPTEESTISNLKSRKPRDDTPSAAETPGPYDTDLDESSPGTTAGRRTPSFMSLMRRTSQTVGSSIVTRAAGYLPASVTGIWEPARDFAWVKIPKSPRTGQFVRSVVAMSAAAPQVMVATSEGEFLVFAIDLERGGEGTLVRQYSVKDKSESHTGLYTG